MRAGARRFDADAAHAELIDDHRGAAACRRDDGDAWRAARKVCGAVAGGRSGFVAIDRSWAVARGRIGARSGIDT
jgi:hypothetical protein